MRKGRIAPSLLMIKVTTNIKDHWSQWTRDFVPAPDFDIESYQRKIDLIAGKSRDESILRLEWGGSGTVSKYTKWDSAGMPLEAELIPRHAIPRRNQILDFIEHIPIRRWIITQRQEPEQYGYGDDSDNTFTDEYGVVCKISEKPKSFYTPLIYVGDHSKCPADCCANTVCLGDYKAPDQSELDWITEATFKLASEFKNDPYKAMSGDMLDEAAKDVLEEVDAQRKQSEDMFNDRFKDWFNAHGHRLSDDDPSVISHGKYKFFKDGKPI